MRTYSTYPRITFQDTNVVGNVYFLTFFRWQAECFDQWLHDNQPEPWRTWRSEKRLLSVTHWTTSFNDPFGATIGDDIQISIEAAEVSDEQMSMTTRVLKGTDGGMLSIGNGKMVVATQPTSDKEHDNHPLGPCYSFTSSVQDSARFNPLDLFAWQGKCRELFLADHSPQTLKRVANRELILQTTNASFDLLNAMPTKIDQVVVEMRLESGIKWGQMVVRFDYFALQRNTERFWFATGKQVMSCKNPNGGGPSVLPIELLLALRCFAHSSELLDKIDGFLQVITAQDASSQ